MPGDQPVQSIQRAMAILHAVAGKEDGCGVRQIVNRTGIKACTVYKLLRTLEAERLLTRRTRPLRYFIGSAIAVLKTLDDERHLLTEAGKILIRAQAGLPQATLAFLEVQNGQIYQRLCVQDSRPGVLIQRREFINPLYDKASSLLFLAYSHRNEAAAFYRKHPFEEKGRHLWGTRGKLEIFLERVRRRGYSQPEVPDSEGPHFRVAAPVFSPGQEVVASVGGFVFSDERVSTRKKLVTVCLAAAKELGATLT